VTRHLPTPITGAEEYLRAVHERLGETNELLRALLDRTPSPVAQVGPVVELREPATPATVAVEPATSGGHPAATAALAEPAPAAKPARRQRTRTTATKEGT